NYPGVTVERREGSLRLPNGETVEVLDLPGTYSLAPRSPDEAIASAALFEGDTDSVWVVVVDANALARTLYLATLVAETDVPLVVALNMVDEVEGRGGRVDVGPVERALGVRCVPIVASKGEGVDALLEAVIAAKPRSPLALPALGPAAGPLARVADGVASAFPSVRAGLVPGLARRFVLATDAELGELPDAIARPTREAIDAGAGEALVRVRYALVDDLTARTVDLPATTRSASERIDDVLTHPWLGTGIFLVVMGLIFEGLFVGAEPVVSVIERAVSAVGGFVAGVMPEGPLEGLVVDGVIAGVGNVVTFVPQIALLFLLLGVLEDSGYLARVAFVLDRLMGAVGLNGRAFVPMISGYACAIPAVMATRTIENAKDRILTMLVIPLMSCSARLPIYVLVTAAVFSGTKPVFGFIAVGAVVLLAMYTLSLVAAVGAAAVLRRTVLRGPRPTLMLELPPYRWP
ncbi:MAG: ferrous iron transport protein B, partial [Myxococcales bacterium]|nr:ferrous iron transport protein B [Myxococcales bacterium]